MAKVDIGKLKKLIKKEPEMAEQLAYGTKAILCNVNNMGEFASFMIFGTDSGTPEIVMRKDELLRFAREIEAKVGPQK